MGDKNPKKREKRKQPKAKMTAANPTTVNPAINSIKQKTNEKVKK